MVTGTLLCLGGWLVASGWAQPRPTVARAMAHLHRSRPTATRDVGSLGRVGAKASELVPEQWIDNWRRPLRLIGRPVDLHVGLLMLASVAGLIVPVAVLGTLQAAGIVGLGIWVPAIVSIVAAVALPALLHSDAIAKSRAVTVDLRHQLGAYLDMVTMLLAGNSGYEGALDQAARAGDGVLFVELRRRMRESSATGSSLVVALDRVADDYGLVELEQVAATATLSAAEGAPIARSLAAKCATLRSTLAAEQEAAARVRNDKLTPPLVGMALLFMALIIYPALTLD
jgi:Flp pilus assembly protein TadB